MPKTQGALENWVSDVASDAAGECGGEMLMEAAELSVRDTTLAALVATSIGAVAIAAEMKLRFDALEKKLDEMEKRLATKIVVWS